MRMRGAARTGTHVGGDLGRRQGNRAGIGLRVAITRGRTSPVDVGYVSSAAFTMRPPAWRWQAAFTIRSGLGVDRLGRQLVRWPLSSQPGPCTVLSKMHTQADRDRARLHIAEGEARIDRQAALIAEMNARGFPTAQAVRVLEALEISLDGMRRHLARIELDYADAPTGDQ